MHMPKTFISLMTFQLPSYLTLPYFTLLYLTLPYFTLHHSLENGLQGNVSKVRKVRRKVP